MKRGQSTLEYVCIIGVAAAALIASLVYIKRGFEGKIRTQADQLGDQYSPTNMRTHTVQTSDVLRVEDVTNDDAAHESKNHTVTDEHTTNEGYEKFER